MTSVIDRLAAGNPLLAHGPRTHATGVATPTPARRPARPAARRGGWWRLLVAEVDAPRVHLGHAGR